MEVIYMSPEPSFTQALREEGFIKGSNAVKSDNNKEDVENIVDNKVDEIIQEVEDTVDNQEAKVEEEVKDEPVSNSLKATDDSSSSSIPIIPIIIVIIILIIILLLLGIL